MNQEYDNTATLPSEPAESISQDNHQPKEANFTSHAKNAMDTIQEKAATTASDILGTAKHKLQETKETAASRLTATRKEIASKAEKAKKEVQSSFERHPLMYVAGALATGVVLGLAIPRSRKEKEAFSESGQKLRDTAERVKEDASQAASSATKAAVRELEEKLEESVATPTKE